ncbi:hexon assembly protein 100 kDa [Simian adenovirus DM-2014]|uniref:Shutoff protein n=1 Tax=Simian adenovirus DM-2014 TaxID=1560346 RepID=A0A097IWA2_9ADEN|nr:hexon assembly protein 100 kDa [Simian adenovirus DM-2014]AIT70985.1 hexon assembly protein 100 kDa [Simian adenovirus DM-2014]
MELERPTESDNLTSPSFYHNEETLTNSTDFEVEADTGYTFPENVQLEKESPLTSSQNENQQNEHPQQQHNTRLQEDYLGGGEDVLLKHIQRQSAIVENAISENTELPVSIYDLSLAYEKNLFSPRIPPKRQANGTCEPNPRLNFYPAFAVPEVLATYHIFFKNHKIPVSCRANRSCADGNLTLGPGARIPDFPSLQEVPKIFEGLGDEKRAANALQENTESFSALVELANDNARLAVLKRTIEVTHFAYPAVNLPPKVMNTVLDCLLVKRAKPMNEAEGDENSDEGKPAVTDEELSRWMRTNNSTDLENRRKMITAVILVTVELECLSRFFTDPETVRKVEETLHYTFRHGYVKQACKISNVELSNLVSYLGILHENRLGQNVLHSTLKGEARRDYIRDCIYLFLCFTWQSAMGVWQQCLEDNNLRELQKLLYRARRELWTGFDEKTVAKDLAGIIFPSRLLRTLQNGLPDFMSQSMIQNFRSFILERSGILPSMSCALPSDFIPLTFKECPPPLWSHCYLFQLANYYAFHSDVIVDVSGEGLMDCHCRCNLCTPHRSLVCNTALLNETQVIGTFEIQGPAESNKQTTGLKLTPGLWTSAYLRKFVPADYHAHEIRFYEDQSGPPKAELTACVITQSSIVAQLQAINEARRAFLLKKGRGVYLDPQTGEELNTPSSAAGFIQNARKEENRPPTHLHTTPETKETGETLECGGERLGESGRHGRGMGQPSQRRGRGRGRDRGHRRKTLTETPFKRYYELRSAHN